MKKSMSSLNFKKKILVKSILFGCAILFPALMFINCADAMNGPDFLDFFYGKNYSYKTDDPSVFLNNKKPNLHVHNYSVKEVFPKDPLDKFRDMKIGASSNIEQDIAEEVEKQISQYDGDYPTYQEECKNILLSEGIDRQKKLNALDARAYEYDFHNYDRISKDPYWDTFWS